MANFQPASLFKASLKLRPVYIMLWVFEIFRH